MKKHYVNPQPSIPVVDSSGKITLVSRTPPASGPRIRYEDLEGVVTRSSCRRVKASSLVPRMPAAMPRTHVHRARCGRGITRRVNR